MMLEPLLLSFHRQCRRLERSSCSERSRKSSTSSLPRSVQGWMEAWDAWERLLSPQMHLTTVAPAWRTWHGVQHRRNPPQPATTYPPPHSQIAASAGVPVILDAGGVTQPIQVDLLSNVSLVSPNETELARLTSEWHGCWTTEWVDGVQGDSIGWPCDPGVRS